MPGVDFLACWLGALLLLILPLDWLIAAACAAVIHELCHAAAILLLGGRIFGLRIGIGGAIIEAEVPGEGRELVCALAGPAGSLLLLTLCHVLPRLALCGAIQGLFNLMPISPLDGGRALRCCLRLLCLEKAESIGKKMELCACGLLLILAVIAMAVFSLGAAPLMVSILLILKARLRKRPCKRRQIRVQ